MSTPYEKIYNPFYKKLINDKEFFNYQDLSISDVELLVKDHSDALLDESIGMIYAYGNPDVDLWDKDDDTQEMAVDLVRQEIRLIVDLMYFNYASEGRNKLQKLGLTFSSRELNVFSPSAERKELENTLSILESGCVSKIQNYLARDRETWEYKSIYGGN